MRTKGSRSVASATFMTSGIGVMSYPDFEIFLGRVSFMVLWYLPLVRSDRAWIPISTYPNYAMLSMGLGWLLARSQ